MSTKTLMRLVATSLCFSVCLGGAVQAQSAAMAQPGQATVLTVGGTSQPSGVETQHSVGMTGVPAGSNVVAVSTPANFAPAYGSMTYDESKYIGAANIERAIEQTAGPTTVVTYSASAVSADIALRHIQDEGRSTNELTIVKMGDPRRNGTTQGIETINPGFVVPGITSGGASVPTNVRVMNYCVQYDPMCDFPVPGSPLSSYVNALMCYFDCHPHYGMGELDSNNAVVEQFGNETDITYRREAPLTQATGIFVPDSLAGHVPASVPAPEPSPVHVQYVAAPVAAPVYVSPPAPVLPVVTQTQVYEAATSVAVAVPAAAPVIDSVMSNPMVQGFLNGLPH